MLNPDGLSSFTWLFFLLVPGVAYVIGSIPTGAIVARLHGNVDLTRAGSARTGATNATRVLGPVAGIMVLLGDFGKGSLAVWAAQQVADPVIGSALAGFFSVVGHTRSVFLGGRGGRGVSTGLGGLAVGAPPVFLVACLSGCFVVGVTRYVSLGSICGCLLGILASVGLFVAGHIPWPILAYVLAASALVLVEHRDNISRLAAGTERKLGER